MKTPQFLINNVWLLKITRHSESDRLSNQKKRKAKGDPHVTNVLEFTVDTILAYSRKEVKTAKIDEKILLCNR